VLVTLYFGVLAAIFVRFVYFGYRCVCVLRAMIDDVNDEIGTPGTPLNSGFAVAKVYWLHEQLRPDDDYLLRKDAGRFFHRTLGTFVLLILGIAAEPFILRHGPW
jgi:hypothetical protein